jgi:tRNA 2-thiocytidine biosynthesis protein TtcA
MRGIHLRKGDMRGMSYLREEVSRQMGRAIHRYRQIEEGDRIGVAVSGGVDSMTLLHLLAERKKRVPITYELVALHIHLGFDGEGYRSLENYLSRRGFRYRIDVTEIGRIAHSSENRENPCFLCSRLRRKRLFEMAHELGCNKVAFAHTRDDIIETLLLNMFYSGEMSTMIPFLPLFGGALTIIRPFAFLPKEKIRQLARKRGLPVWESLCPSIHRSKRSEMRRVLEGIAAQNPKVMGNILRSMKNIKRDYLL